MSRFIKLLVVFYLSAMPAMAEELLAPIEFTGRYALEMAGIPFGSIDISFEQDASRYHAVSDAATVGIARMFVKHSSHSTSQGSGAGFHYNDVEYASDYSTRNKKKSARFTKKNGVMTRSQSLPPDEKRPVVSQALKNTAYDPLAIALAIRVELARALQGGPQDFTLDYFDGKRLYRADFSYEGEKNIRIHGQKYPVHVVTATRKLIGGYTPKEFEKAKEPEPTLSIYFSNDGRLVPLRLDVPLGFATAAATLAM